MRFQDNSAWPIQRRPLFSAVLLGSATGVLFRLLTKIPVLLSSARVDVLMTLAFLVFCPIAIGHITLTEALKSKNRPVWLWIFLPWIPILVSVAITYILNLEGLICIVFATPIALISSSIGGITAGLSARRALSNRTTLTCFTVLPLLVASVEMRLPVPTQLRQVQTQIEIRASSDTIWRNIERVKTIAPEEIQSTWTEAIGFPRPVSATLSYQGVGGIRHASFERGLLFIETVTEWNPNNVLAFSIEADTTHISPSTLDDHVTIGGRYFDVLKGEYRLEQRPDGTVLLRLSSRQRLSTDFNDYAGLWTDAVMRSLQSGILAVIKQRCESAAN